MCKVLCQVLRDSVANDTDYAPSFLGFAFNDDSDLNQHSLIKSLLHAKHRVNFVTSIIFFKRHNNPMTLILLVCLKISFP